jgi:hypothetical protein
VKTYPTIGWRPQYLSSCYVFGKYDGSNVRAEWHPRKGFWKFGRRKALLDDSNPILQEAPDLIMRDWAVDLASVFKSMRLQKATAFFEFWGDNSFAGNHEDEEHRCTLLDATAHPKGILPPKDFVKVFKGLDHAALLHQGNFNRAMEEQVRSGTLPGMPFEGVIVKGGLISPGRPLMFKVKNRAWFERLRAQYPQHEDNAEAPGGPE